MGKGSDGTKREGREAISAVGLSSFFPANFILSLSLFHLSICTHKRTLERIRQSPNGRENGDQFWTSRPPLVPLSANGEAVRCWGLRAIPQKKKTTKFCR